MSVRVKLFGLLYIIPQSITIAGDCFLVRSMGVEAQFVTCPVTFESFGILSKLANLAFGFVDCQKYLSICLDLR